MTEENNAAIKIADDMARFMKPASSSDAEILNTTARYSLQIRPDQHLILNRLEMLIHHPLMPNSGKDAIRAFIPIYQEMKRYHDSMPFIGRAIEAISLKKAWDMGAITGNIAVKK